MTGSKAHDLMFMIGEGLTPHVVRVEGWVAMLYPIN